MAAPDLEQQQRLAFLRSVSWTGALIAAPLALVYAFGLRFPLGAGVLLCCGLLFLAALRLGRWSVRAAAHLVCAAVTLAVAFIASIRGDLPLGALVFLLVNPVVVAYLVGPRAAVAWAAAGVALVGAVLVRLKLGLAAAIPQLTTPEALAQRDALEAFALVGVLALLTSAALSIASRRAAVEQERLRLREELEARAAGARLGRLASGVAHEINNPLAWVTSGLSFLQKRFADSSEPEVQEVLGELTQGAARLGAVVADLQAVARYESSPEDVADPVRVVRIVRSLGTVEVGRRGTLVVEAPERLPLIHGNEGALAEALLELLLDATRGDARLAVGVEGAHVVFAVSPVSEADVTRARGVLASWGGALELRGPEARLALPRAGG